MTLIERLEARMLPFADQPKAAARIRELEAALAPFSKEAEGWDADQNGGHLFLDEDGIDMEHRLRVGHLRTARRALLTDDDSGET